jgi:hypothetical protein
MVKPKKRETSMTDYYNRMKKLADTMATIGNPLEEDEIISYILGGLGDDHENFTTAMTVVTTKNEDFTLSDLYSHMSAYEARSDDRSPSPQFQHSANNAYRGCGRGNLQRGGGNGRGRGDGGGRGYGGAAMAATATTADAVTTLGVVATPRDAATTAVVAAAAGSRPAKYVAYTATTHCVATPASTTPFSLNRPVVSQPTPTPTSRSTPASHGSWILEPHTT